MLNLGLLLITEHFYIVVLVIFYFSKGSEYFLHHRWRRTHRCTHWGYWDHSFWRRPNPPLLLAQHSVYKLGSTSEVCSSAHCLKTWNNHHCEPKQYSPQEVPDKPWRSIFYVNVKSASDWSTVLSFGCIKTGFKDSVKSVYFSLHTLLKNWFSNWKSVRVEEEAT